nr:MAG TPA: hypothetical protein [Caudoviricetes sp.]
MAENMIKFLRGNVASLPQTAIEGALYFTKDEGVYLGLADGKYHRYGDFIQVDAVADLPTAGAHVNCMYYCVAENILAKWNGTEWIQINKQKTLAELGGVAKSVYDEKIKALEGADTTNATAISDLKTLVGVIPDGYTESNVIAYVNKKAQETLDAASGGTSESAASVKAALETYKAANDPKVTANKTAADNAKSAADNAQADVDALKEKVGTIADSKTVVDLISDAKAQADKGVSDAATAKTAADAAQSGVNDINTKIGTVTEGKTVVEMINDAKTAATYDDAGVKASIKANADAIGVLNGADTVDGSVAKAVKTAQTTLQSNIDTVSGKVTTLVGSVKGDDAKSARTIASEEVAKIVAGADTAYDTLKEISDWISGHKTDAAAMNSAITVLEGIVDGIGGEGEKATVKAYVDDAITALKIGDYAKAADLTALAARVTTVEGQIAILTGEETVAGSVKKALADAKSYADGKDSAMDTRVKALEADTHTHANKAELDKIEAGDKAKWDAAQANAEATAATALDTAKKELNTAIGKKADQTALDTVSGKVDANTANITKIMGDATTEGSFAKADSALKTELQGYADTAETDAVNASKTYTDGLLTWGEF